MRVALDTNIVVRLLVVDDEPQALAARQILMEAEQIVIPTIVLCEAAWVLKRAYRFPSSTLAEALRRVIQLQGVEVDRPVVEAGLSFLDQGGDFADGCILYAANQARCETLLTFDRALAALSGGGATVLEA
jgi:predicted nucleic-acid-binding protein